MAGIYIHIPFCKKKCFYCDFYKTTSLKYKDDFIKSLLKEIKIRKDFISDKNIETIYFGGGSPTLLSFNELKIVFDELYQNFSISENAEITLEANPDDLTKKYLGELRKTPVNRLSIGLQSFFDDDLKLMNRRHTAGEAIRSVTVSQDFGFENISGDLIYGLPNMNGEKWRKNLNIFFELNVAHLSAYHLTYEEDTVFYKWLKSGKLKEEDENISKEYFTILIEETLKNNFIQYELSNFAKTGYFSKHNSSYWLQKQYLGLGPSAHSYNIEKRAWNISDIKQYIERVGEGKDFFESEILDEKANYNDYVITTLRTVWGIDLQYVERQFGIKYKNYIIKNSQKYLSGQFLVLSTNKLILGSEGKFISDKIITDLFYL